MSKQTLEKDANFQAKFQGCLNGIRRKRADNIDSSFAHMDKVRQLSYMSSLSYGFFSYVGVYFQYTKFIPSLDELLQVARVPEEDDG